MYLAGQVSVMQTHQLLRLAMVQIFLCSWWTLPFLNRLMDIQKPGYTLYPYFAGSSKIQNVRHCSTGIL
ncbi:hypothetical protein DAPPUDRAFT_251218 [Daphnia pulex]|uniref:Uncharacterized protein n=1 Tax=Daphnia pulex TaxID=6669 RepID=E9GZY7_DAPPU|nr:hypothetical protein DAPPUDRAFT_251218 [Daphnia pulex]|eukprot:EFX74902.1 hypothetical protein DAPPUDRAFT_251218 [Daphnia pulex]